MPSFLKYVLLVTSVKQNTVQLRKEAVIADLSGKIIQFISTDISGEECN